MVYPAMLIAVAVIVVAIIMIVAVPVFEKSFASQGNELPGPTKLLIAMSHFMVDNWLLLIAVIAAVALGIFFYGKTDSGAHLYARIALSFPGLGLVNKMNAASQFATTFSTMLASGLPLVSAARITANTSDNLLIQEDIEKAVNGVIEGNRLADGMKGSKWFPGMLLEMISVGEETGKLEDTLNVVSDYYTQEVDSAVKKALDILNPCITMALAGIVVFILLSVYLPLFSLY
jgi:type IV pilus assembly protein PilC